MFSIRKRVFFEFKERSVMGGYRKSTIVLRYEKNWRASVRWSADEPSNEDKDERVDWIFCRTRAESHAKSVFVSIPRCSQSTCRHVTRPSLRLHWRAYIDVDCVCIDNWSNEKIFFPFFIYYSRRAYGYGHRPRWIFRVALLPWGYVTQPYINLRTLVSFCQSLGLIRIVS